MKPPLISGEAYHGVRVARRLAPDTHPPAWTAHPTTTLLVSCPRCGHEVRALESHVRCGTFKHSRAQCFAPIDTDELLAELEADGDLS